MNGDDFRRMISENTKNWDLKRIAFMDVVIMQMCHCRADSPSQTFLSSVTLNEYLEIAKYYSTPKSTSFINGTLDAIIKKTAKHDGTYHQRIIY
jgi:N utilization substance protein B